MYKKTLSNIFYICVFYTLMLSATLLIIFSTVTTNDIQSSFQREEGLIKSEFEKIYTQNSLISGDVFSSEYVAKYVNEDDKYAKLKFQQELSTYVNLVAPAIDCIAVFRAGDEDFYCSNGAQTLSYYAMGISQTERYLFEVFDAIKNGSRYKATDYFISGEMLTAVTHNRTVYEDVYLLVTFNIGDVFSRTLSEEKEVFVFQGDTILYQTNEKLSSAALSALKKGDALGYNSSIVNVAVTENSDPLRIVCIAPKITYATKYLMPVIIAIVLSLLILMIGVYVARKIAEGIYKPVKSLLGMVDDMPDAIEDEFETIKHFIDELKGENASMQESIKEKEDVLDNQFLASVLVGDCDPDYMQGYIKKNHLSNKKLNVTVLKYTEYDLIYSSLTEKQFYSLKGVIKDLLDEKFSDYDYFSTANLLPEGYVLIHSGKDIREFEKDITGVINIVDKKFSINLCAYIGDEVASLDELYKSYNDALYISRCTTFQNAYRPVYTKKSLLEIQHDNFVYPIEIESALISAVLSYDLKAAKDNIDFLISINATASQRHDRFVQLVTMFSATISRIASELDVDLEEVLGEDASVYLELRQTENFAELAGSINGILETLIEYSSKANITEFTSIKESIEKYIDRNYQTDISLSDLAKHLKLSETYVSKLFKVSMGKNFKEYLMHYKYLKAKQIMKDNPTYKLKDVAKMIGCNTPLTLSRLLKKYDKEQ